MFKQTSHFDEGKWSIDDNKFTYRLSFELTAISVPFFHIQKKAGYNDLFYIK